MTLNDISNKKSTVIRALFILAISIIFFIAITQSIIAIPEDPVNNIGSTASTDSDERIKNVLKSCKVNEVDSVSDFATNTFRSIGFAMVKFMANIGDALYKGLFDIFNAVTFSYGSEIVGLVNRYSALYKAFFLVALCIFGVKLIMGKHEQLNTVNCIIIMILILSAMPLMMQKVGKLTITSSEFVAAQWNTTGNSNMVNSVAGRAIENHIVDLKKVDEYLTKNPKAQSIPAEARKGKDYNYLDGNEWKYIDINAYMDYENDNLQHKSIWENRIEPSDDGKSGFALESMSGWTKYTSNYYYRYQITSWFSIFVILGTMTILMFFIIIRAAKIVIDLAVSMIYTPFIAVTDLSTGQRIKAVIKDIIAHFAALFILSAIMGVFFVAYSYIEHSSMGTFPKLAMYIALVWAIIDGPNIIERIMGVDVGYGGVWKAVLGAKAAADVGKGVGKVSKDVASTAAGAAAKGGKAAGNIFFGKERINNAKDTVKNTAGDIKNAAGNTVKKATDGKGLLGGAEKYSNDLKSAISTSINDGHSTDALQQNITHREPGNYKESGRSGLSSIYSQGRNSNLPKQNIQNKAVNSSARNRSVTSSKPLYKTNLQRMQNIEQLKNNTKKKK